MSLLQVIAGAAELAIGGVTGYYPLALAGAGQLLSAAFAPPPEGFATTIRGSIEPWSICYGTVRAPSTLIYINTWGQSNVICDLVMAVAAHPTEGLIELLFENQRVQIDTNALPAYPGWLTQRPEPGSGTTFSP